MRNYIAHAGTRVTVVRAASMAEARRLAWALIGKASFRSPLAAGYDSMVVRRATRAEVEAFAAAQAQAAAGLNGARR